MEDAWQENEHGEQYRIDDHALVAVEEVYEFSVGTLRHQVDHYIRYGVVDPMENDAWDDRASAIIHPSEQQADEESVYALGQVEVHYAED